MRELFIDQRQEEVIAGWRSRSCLPSPKAAGECVRAACHPTSVRLTDSAAQGLAATVNIVFFCYIYQFTLYNKSGQLLRDTF